MTDNLQKIIEQIGLENILKYDFDFNESLLIIDSGIKTKKYSIYYDSKEVLLDDLQHLCNLHNAHKNGLVLDTEMDKEQAKEEYKKETETAFATYIHILPVVAFFIGLIIFAPLVSIATHNLLIRLLSIFLPLTITTILSPIHYIVKKKSFKEKMSDLDIFRETGIQKQHEILINLNQIMTAIQMNNIKLKQNQKPERIKMSKEELLHLRDEITSLIGSMDSSIQIDDKTTDDYQKHLAL